MSKTSTAAVGAATAAPATGFRRVVIAVGSDGGVAAVDLARALAAPDAVTVLVRVHHAPHSAKPVTGQTAAERDTADAMRLLRIGRAALDEPCEIVVEDGADLVEALQRVAEREAADLLVIGAHRGLTDAPSVLPKVVHQLPCAVAIVGQRPTDPFALRRVGVGYCTSPAGEHAAHVGGAIASRHDAELHAMHVVAVTVSPWMGPAASTLHTLQRLDGSLADAATAAITNLRPPATAHVVEGEPNEQLAAFAETVDLLVLGSRSLGPVRRLMLGSLTDELSTRSPCALLVVAGPVAQADESPA